MGSGSGEAGGTQGMSPLVTYSYLPQRLALRPPREGNSAEAPGAACLSHTDDGWGSLTRLGLGWHGLGLEGVTQHVQGCREGGVLVYFSPSPVPGLCWPSSRLALHVARG